MGNHQTLCFIILDFRTELKAAVGNAAVAGLIAKLAYQHLSLKSSRKKQSSSSQNM
jgi:hypothetical protein